MSAGHHEQSYRNSCVPGCMFMIQRWRGEPPTEDAFHHGAAPKGHEITHVYNLPRIEPFQWCFAGHAVVALP